MSEKYKVRNHEQAYFMILTVVGRMFSSARNYADREGLLEVEVLQDAQMYNR